MQTRPSPSVFNARRAFSNRTIAVLLAIVVGGLPIAVWLDLRTLSERQLTESALELSGIIDDLRDFYAENVVARAVTPDSSVSASHRYFEETDSIPIPATFSLELVSIFSGDGDSMTYRFVSEHPFANRAPHVLTDFEQEALETLEADPGAAPLAISGGLFDRRVKLATPVRMAQSCVECHNTHPESRKRDWEIGDVRGIQAITVQQNIAANSFAFGALSVYFASLVAVACFVLLRLRSQSLDLRSANQRLATLTRRVARYISPKIFQRLFSLADDEDLRTDRRKLTIFFSDLSGFTEISERLQPEELTELLNTYFTEMATIAEAHGGTLDKFVGDAVLVFFGDPISNGMREDARACLRMALAMRDRIHALTEEWRARGIDWPFHMRMGINTGYCNVGNFGSRDRLSYTIIGAEVNLAARLQEHCAPGEIALAQETYVHVKDLAPAREADPIHAKGISNPVTYFVISDELATPQKVDVALAGMELKLDVDQLSEEDADRARRSLRSALTQLDRR